MALDLSGRTDDEIRLAFNAMGMHPEYWKNNPEYQAALGREYNRRFQSPPAAEPADVAAKLAAAAAPIATDPEVRAQSPRDAYTAAAVEDGWTPDEAATLAASEAGMPEGSFNPGLYNSPRARDASRAGARYVRGQRAQEAQFDRSLAEAMGHNYTPPDVNGPDTVMVDGVRVRTHQLSDGQPFGGMYTLGALREAKDAANEERLAAMFSKSAQEDLAKYGTENFYEYARDPATGALMKDAKGRPVAVENAPMRNDALAARRGVEQRQQSQNAALRDRPGLQRMDDERALRRERYADMARLAGGSSGLRGGAEGNIGMLQALAMLQGADPNNLDARQRNLMYASPGGQGAVAVDARNMQNAGDILQRFFTSGAAGGMMNPEAIAAARDSREQKMRQDAYDFAVDERNRVHWNNNAPMDAALANQIRLRVAARFGNQYANVVDALPLADVVADGGE